MVNLDCRWLVNQRQVYLPTVPKHICLVNSPHLYQVKANYFCAFKIWLAFWTYCISQPLLQMKGNSEPRWCFIFNKSVSVWSVLDILKWLALLFAGGHLLEFPPHILWGLHLQSFRWALLPALSLCFCASMLKIYKVGIFTCDFITW